MESFKTKTMKKIYILLLLLTAAFSFSSAQTFTNYTSVDGLVNDAVNALTTDNQGNVWFGTQDGISKFDGSNFTNYTTADGLIDNAITAIASDENGVIWVGTDFGVSRFDGTNFVNYTDNEGLADNRIKHINASIPNQVWFGNNDGVSILENGTWTSYTTADGLPFGGVNFITEGSATNVLLGTSLGGVRIFDGSDFTAITEDEGLLNDKIRSIAIDQQDNIWIGNSDGISVFDTDYNFVTNHEIIFELPPPDKLNPVEDVLVDNNGCIWAGVYVDYLVTEGGVSYYDGVIWKDLDVSDGLVGPVVRRLAIDNENNIWVATSTGVSKISDVDCNFITSTRSIELQARVNIHPNPTSDFFQIHTDLNEAFDVQIYNNIGQQVMLLTDIYNGSNINIRGLQKGIYFVQLTDQQGASLVKKVVLE